MTLYDKILVKIKNAEFLKQERGTIFVLTALLLPLMFGFLGFAYDVGNLYMHKARLQNTADAAVLAGARAYINKLGENAVNDIATNATDNQKAAAKSQLKSEAERYIRGNNPLFVGKAGRKEDFKFGIRTVSNDTTKKKVNTSEYFRVILREPVGLFFLPVIGVRNKVEVSVYATTKLSDTETTEGDGTPPSIVDAENRPVVIAGNTFFDEINPTDTTHDTYNDYNVSTVYVQTGGTIKARKENGKYYVPSSQGETTLIVNGQPVKYAEVVETDYDMAAFGEAIKQRFIDKQNYSNEQLAPYYADKQKWNEGNVNHLAAYKEWQKGTVSYTKPTTLEDAKNIHSTLMTYLAMYEPWNDSTTWAKVKDQWIADGYPITNDESQLSHIIRNEDPNLKLKYNYNFIQGPQESSWKSQFPYNYLIEINKGTILRDGKKQPVLSDYTGGLTKEPIISDSKYGGLEYYATYHGSEKQNLSLHDVTYNPSNYGLGTERSYFYYSFSNIQGANNLSVTVDGLYVDDKITGDTPFYLFVESDINITNFTVTDCNRPIVLCYLGNQDVSYVFNVDTKGIFYSPHARNGTKVNASDGIKFSGSIISDYVEMKAHRNKYKYDPEDIKKWQKGDDGLPATPNIGFASSGGSSGGGTGESSEKITLLDRLRLYLAGGSNENNYYKNSDIIWSDI